MFIKNKTYAGPGKPVLKSFTTEKACAEGSPAPAASLANAILAERSQRLKTAITKFPKQKAQCTQVPRWKLLRWESQLGNVDSGRHIARLRAASASRGKTSRE